MGTIDKNDVRILITGSNGQLGQKLVKHCLDNKFKFLATALNENQLSFCPGSNFQKMDVTAKKEVEKSISCYQPTHILHTAAMTNVDRCEDDVELCYKINVDAVDHILEAIKDTRIHFIHLSTDFIFDGKKQLYNEEDVPNPLGEYGKSKWESEQLIKNRGHFYCTILRTSLVYSTGENLMKDNIFKWAMKKLRDGDELAIVNDQFRTPTYVMDVVQAIFSVIKKEAYGVFNIAGSELKSMYEFIVDVSRYVDVNPQQVKAISSEELNQKAIRPKSSGLIIQKAKDQLNYSPTKFIDSLSKIDMFI